MQHFATTLRPAPTQVKQSKTVYMPRELKTCTHIFVKQDPIKTQFDLCLFQTIFGGLPH